MKYNLRAFQHHYTTDLVHQWRHFDIDIYHDVWYHYGWWSDTRIVIRDYDTGNWITEEDGTYDVIHDIVMADFEQRTSDKLNHVDLFLNAHNNVL
jgi:hypothetical protein